MTKTANTYVVTLRERPGEGRHVVLTIKASTEDEARAMLKDYLSDEEFTESGDYELREAVQIPDELKAQIAAGTDPNAFIRAIDLRMSGRVVESKKIVPGLPTARGISPVRGARHA